VTLNSIRLVAAAVVAALSFMATSTVAAQSAESEVARVVNAYHTALASGDSVTALGLLADDVVILESGGLENKEHYRSGHLAGDMRFAQAVPRERGEIHVVFEGDVAWAYSTNTTQGTMGEREINSRGAELMVLARDGGTWKIRAVHWSSRQVR